GGNFIDTADVYPDWAPGNSGGESEAIIGRWIERRGGHDDLVIATKVGRRRGLGPAAIRASVEACRRRLGVERIDLLYAHLDDPATPLARTLETFDSLIAAGTVGAIGASNYSGPRLREALALAADRGLAPFTVYQSQYNLLERSRILDPEAMAEPFEPDLQSTCVEHGLAFVPYWVLAKGYLTGKYRTAGRPATGSARAAVHRVRDYASDRAAAVLDALETVAAAHRVSPAAIALAWTAAQPTVVAPLASARTVDQLEELLPFADLSLSPAEIALISAASQDSASSRSS
ncbi:MAG TPA: aldo/keto reductase, partial [Solirubrobacterales bacterium]|nr:aldo/keto reductase [Solirubrobacterales bacterium]